MTSRDFAYWLQGVFEVGGATSFNEAQTAMIRQHLALVFKHDIDPSAGDAAHQALLDAIHTPNGIPAAPPQPRPPPWATNEPSGYKVRC